MTNARTARVPACILALVILALLASCGSSSHHQPTSITATYRDSGDGGPAPPNEPVKKHSTPTPAEREEAVGTVKDIAAYGHEASASDRRAIAEVVTRYYDAAARDDGAAACRLLYSLIEEAVPEDWGKPPGPAYLRGNTCPVVLTKLFKHLRGQSPSVLANTHVTGVRIGHRHGFAQLSSSALPEGAIFVEREGHRWTVGTLIGTACTRCAGDPHRH